MSKMAKIQAQLERATGKAPISKTTPKPDLPPSRQGKTHIGAYLNPAHKTSLRLVQAKTGKDLQSILHDALNETYRRYDVPVVG